MKLQWLSFCLCVLAASKSATGETNPLFPAFNHDDYGTVLSKHVDENGMVDYRALQQNRSTLDQYVKRLAEVDSDAFQRWSEADRLAFWINAYNALTLKLIIDHYPIQSSFFASLRFPKNSIRQISGAWDSIQFTVMGRSMTLDHIEHEIIRKEFHEPRIHFALVCAAKGCPPLRSEPYEGSRLHEQLDDQIRAVLANSDKFKIDSSSKRVHLTKILDWFGDDFVGSATGSDRFSSYSKSNGAVLNFLYPYLSESEQAFLNTESFRIVFLEYDWSLNEQG